ncbi:hypothetical protein GCM10009850_121290 [Nonomuraea monospora]|uniref:Novel STAND NTPase 1 domain-containing protein n=1 Tax=Nonomuraea monospora TaxID=568818 RepID=A0ABP5PZ01_9ACTN
MGHEAPTPRQLFAQRFRALLKLSDLPLKAVASSANSRRPSGESWEVTVQRISAWQGGVNVPRLYRMFEVVVGVLIDACRDKRAPVDETDDLFDLTAWHTLWSQAWAPLPDASPASKERWAEQGPYLGSAAYQQHQADLFFGRDHLIADLLGSLTERLKDPALLVVSGAAGTGKSSLLHAGMLPALAGGRLGEEVAAWPVLTMTPTVAPMQELARMLASLGDDDSPAIRNRLKEGPQQVVRDAVMTRADAGSHRLVLVVDQFEDVLSPLPQEGNMAARTQERLDFVETLHAIATTACGPGDTPAALVVIAVRDDFLKSAAAYPQLKDSLQRSRRFIVEPMNQMELRLAIEMPARLAGLELESDLAGLVLEELRQGTSGPGPGSLPLLAAAMHATWQHRDGDLLTISSYERSRGIAGVIHDSADALLDHLTPQQRREARELTHRLVKIAADGRFVSRPMAYQPSDRQSDFDVVVQRFIKERLLTATTTEEVSTGGTSSALPTTEVVITHDALLGWKTLSDWLKDILASRALRTALLDDADAWIRYAKDSSYLYRDTRLAAVLTEREQWEGAPDRYPPLPDGAQAFLDASWHAATRTARRRRKLLALLSGLLVIAVAGATVAMVMGRAAEMSARIASSRHLMSRSEIVTDPVARLQLGIAAAHINPGPEARANLLVHMATAGFTATLTPDPSPHDSIIGLASSAGGSVLATAVTTSPTEGAVLLWDVRDREHPRVVSTLRSPHDRVSSVAFSGNTLVAVGSGSGTIGLWNVSNLDAPHRIGRLVGHTGLVHDVEFSRDAQTLVSAGADKTVRVWDVRIPASPRAVSVLPEHPAAVGAASFSPDGDLLATADVDGNAWLWNTANPAQPQQLSAIAHPGVNDVAFSPDGETLATADAGGTVHLLDVGEPDKPPRTTAPLTGHKDSVLGVAFSPDGRTIATGSADHTTRIWNLRAEGGPAPLATLEGHSSWTLRPAYTPDGAFLTTASYDGTARLWPVADPKHLPTTATLPTKRHKAQATAIAFSPDGATLATNEHDKVRLWDITNRSAPRSLKLLPGHRGIVADVLFSPQGDLLAATTSGGDILTWSVKDIRHPQLLHAFTGHSAAVNDADFSPDGTLLATASFDHTAKVW